MKVDQKVAIIGSRGNTERLGVIAGIGHLFEAGDTRPVYLVRLDVGFYDPTGNTYVSTIVVARDSLVAI